MSSARQAVMTDEDASGAIDASRAALGLAIVIALMMVAALSFAGHGDAQATPDEIAQLGD